MLEDDQVLELRSVDLYKSDQVKKEASLILRLRFPAQICHGGVDLADTQDQASVSVFALTKTHELYTCTLLPDFFCDTTTSEEDISTWCKIFKPASFSLSTPHRLVAESSLAVTIALGDGRLLRLTRKSGQDGSRWKERSFGDGQWASSIRGLVRWQGHNSVRYDGNILDQGTAAVLASSPDKKHLFGVSLGHSLKVWNLEAGKHIFSIDLLGLQRRPEDIPKLMLDPGNPNLLQIFQADPIMDGDRYYVMTFSPHDLGQFKVWGVRDAEYGDHGIRDVFSDHVLMAPDPDPSPDSKVIWKVADFKLKEATQGNEMEMWILIRSNKQL